MGKRHWWISGGAPPGESAAAPPGESAERPPRSSTRSLLQRIRSRLRCELGGGEPATLFSCREVRETRQGAVGAGIGVPLQRLAKVYAPQDSDTEWIDDTTAYIDVDVERENAPWRVPPGSIHISSVQPCVVTECVDHIGGTRIERRAQNEDTEWLDDTGIHDEIGWVDEDSIRNGTARAAARAGSDWHGHAEEEEEVEEYDDPPVKVSCSARLATIVCNGCYVVLDSIQVTGSAVLAASI
jgi:hypothetical protein